MLALIITFSFAIIIDILVFFLLKWTAILKIQKHRYYWIINSFLLFLLFIPALIIKEPGLNPVIYRFYFYWLAVYLIIFLPKSVLAIFFLIASICKVAKLEKVKKYILVAGFFISSLFFIIILYGILFGKNNITLKQESLSFKQLPKSFNGFKIVQISDIHLGSFCDTIFISKAFDQINALNPDIIVMTGDMINVVSDEARPFIPVFNRLKATFGKYAILGNHDMNDYRKFDSIKAKEAEILKLVYIEREMGFVVLRDSSIILKKENDSILLTGVNNWGLPPFKQHGHLAKALSGFETMACKILLSHDPTHWRAEVLPKTDIMLTLSGHTHGMQFGINTSWLRWSPSIYKYPENMGVYKQGNQYLYVNVGLGFIGFAGRVGVSPEITLITLFSN